MNNNTGPRNQREGKILHKKSTRDLQPSRRRSVKRKCDSSGDKNGNSKLELNDSRIEEGSSPFHKQIGDLIANVMDSVHVHNKSEKEEHYFCSGNTQPRKCSRNALSVSDFHQRRYDKCMQDCPDGVMVLREALMTQQEALNALLIELEEERNASATAANEAMAMIARLQEEKASLVLEARQFKRIAEEKEYHDKEAIALLREILAEKNDFIRDLKQEREAYRTLLCRDEGEEILTKSLRLSESLGRYGETDNICDGEGDCLFNDGHSPVAAKETTTTTLQEAEVIDLRNSINYKGLCELDSVRSNLADLFEMAVDDEESQLPNSNSKGCPKEEFMCSPGNIDKGCSGANLLSVWDKVSRLEKRLEVLGECQRETKLQVECSLARHSLGIAPDFSNSGSMESSPSCEGVSKGSFDMNNRLGSQSVCATSESPKISSVSAISFSSNTPLDLSEETRDIFEVSHDTTTNKPKETFKGLDLGQDGERKRILLVRTEALEANRLVMKQTIESLRKENKELKLLQEIKKQLCELEGLVPETKEQLQSLKSHFSFSSIFKGILSYIGLQDDAVQVHLDKSEYCKLGAGLLMEKDMDFSTGLSHLLDESSCHYITTTCVRRGMKAQC